MASYKTSDTELTATRYHDTEWDGVTRHIFTCSNCGNAHQYPVSHYCSNCGAKFNDTWYHTDNPKDITRGKKL